MVDEIYFVYENADGTEGRGPMVIIKDSGYFTNEKEAWDFADTFSGVMGRKPQSGSWRNEQYPDVEVRRFLRHNSGKLLKKRNLEKQIEQLKKELELLK